MKIYTESVPFDLAKELKEIGFGQQPELNYRGTAEVYFGEDYCDCSDRIIYAPTYAKVLDWLLEEHSLLLSIDFVGGLYHPFIYDTIGQKGPASSEAHEDINQALYLGVKRALELI